MVLLLGVIFFFCIPMSYDISLGNKNKQYVQSFLQKHSSPYSVTLNGEADDFEEVYYLIRIDDTEAIVTVSNYNISVSSLDIGIDGHVSTLYDPLNDFDIKILSNAGIGVSKLQAGQNINDYNNAAVGKLIKYLFVEIESFGNKPAPPEQDKYAY